MIGLKELCTGMLMGLLFASFGVSEDGTGVKSDLPEGNNGIASMYPGDKGIENEPDVVFVEDFESAASVDELEERWDSVKNAGIMSFSFRSCRLAAALSVS